MKKLLILLIAGLPLWTMAQIDRPEWCESTARNLFYPDDEYLVGYSAGHVEKGETVDKALARMTTAAQADAAQKLQVHVESSTFDVICNVQRRTHNEMSEEMRSLFDREITTHTVADLPNLRTLVWNDRKGTEAAVLVYTLRSDFVRYYDRQIENLLGKMENARDIALEQERQGRKLKGCNTATEALALCPDVEQAQSLSALADRNATLESLQLPRYTAAVKQLNDIVVRLRHATAIVVRCKALLEGNSYALLDSEVRGGLSTQGCHFTSDSLEADWVIDINAEVIDTRQPTGSRLCFAYVDGTLKVTNAATGRKVFEGRLSSLGEGHADGFKGGDIACNKAARLAYSDAAQAIVNKIIKQVQE